MFSAPYGAKNAQPMTGRGTLSTHPQTAQAWGRSRISFPFSGDYPPTAPLYSALKVGGRKSCDEARQGRPLCPRPVQVESLTLIAHDENGLFTDFELRCGKGTYVRSIVRDMGRALRCYGYAGSIDRWSVDLQKRKGINVRNTCQGGWFCRNKGSYAGVFKGCWTTSRLFV